MMLNISKISTLSFFLFLLALPLLAFQTTSQSNQPEPSTMEAAYLESKESLVGLKDAAYQKLMDANEALASAREGVWEATHSAWDAAHDTYEKAKNQVTDYMKTSGQTVQSNYEGAKDEFIQAMKNAGDYVTAVKIKTTIVYWDQLDKLNKLEDAAKKKYHDAYDAMSNYYNEAYQEAKKDLQASAETLAHAQERLQNYVKDEKYKASANYERTKEQLEKARMRAQENYDAAKKSVEETRGKMNEFLEKGLEIWNSYWEETKARAQAATEAMKKYNEEAKEEASEEYKAIKDKMKQAANAAQELANTAGQYLTSVHQKFKEFQHLASEKMQERLEHMTSAV